MKLVKKLTAVVLTAAMCIGFSATALADEVIIEADIVASGPEVTGVTIVPDEEMFPEPGAVFKVTVTPPAGRDGTVGDPVEVPVYKIQFTPEGEIKLETDPFNRNGSVSVWYGLPAKEASSGREAQEEQELKVWGPEAVSGIRYAIEKDFSTGVYNGKYTDAEGKEVALDITYRLFVPEGHEDEELPLVMVMHGSGESGTDGQAHMIASKIATCWADPSWQKDHPCYVFAPQWPVSDVSNDLELRDKYLAVYDEMLNAVKADLKVSKTYLCTLSMGSRLGFRYLTLMPDSFDAALMCCGAIQNADLSNLSEKPVWLVHAISDMVNNVAGSIEAYKQMRSAGNKNVKMTLITDAGMFGVFNHASWQQVMGNPLYMEWLFEQ